MLPAAVAGAEVGNFFCKGAELTEFFPGTAELNKQCRAGDRVGRCLIVEFNNIIAGEETLIEICCICQTVLVVVRDKDQTCPSIILFRFSECDFAFRIAVNPLVRVEFQNFERSSLCDGCTRCNGFCAHVIQFEIVDENRGVRAVKGHHDLTAHCIFRSFEGNFDEMPFIICRNEFGKRETDAARAVVGSALFCEIHTDSASFDHFRIHFCPACDYILVSRCEFLVKIGDKIVVRCEYNG